ncbi:MAG TPA: cysteine--tRNA ligase [Gaiellales bacterium]|nr:cysteine--tRNA ligase [Gaiellales bacterium]
MRLRDTLTGELRELEPGPDGAIGIYVCGPTIYDRIHVGNARPVVVFLQMKRYLEWCGQPVRLVENITDINDKIYAAARAKGMRSDELAAEMARAFIEDTDRLGLGRPDAEPLATETVPEIIALIEELIAAGHAYEAGGDVYFAVRSFDRYGELSGQRPDDVESGSRVEPGEHKRDPVDFALWKATKDDEDTWWASPWGDGRPAWHIECSVMAEKLLGREFSVHGGGRDLIFPHHENEIAQSCSVGRGFARVWAHNGMLELRGEKMSKSEGNIEGLAQALDRWGPEVLVMLFLQAHYRSPMEYSDATLEQARTACETLRNRLRSGTGEDPAVREAVREALDDDFNTPRALAVLFTAPPEARDTVAEVLDVLGLGGLAEVEEAPGEVELLAEARRAARERRDFAESDRLRDEIAALGWEVRDTAGGHELVRRD